MGWRNFAPAQLEFTFPLDYTKILVTSYVAFAACYSLTLWTACDRDLHNNSLNGTIPVLSGLTSLNELWATNHQSLYWQLGYGCSVSRQFNDIIYDHHVFLGYSSGKVSLSLFWVVFLWFYVRRLNGNALTGQLADVFQNLGSMNMTNKVVTALQTLDLSSNRFTGVFEIPTICERFLLMQQL